MRVGISTIYSWRPHVEHAYFLAKLLEEAGHQAFFLTCDSDLPSCYTKELRSSAMGIGHCVGCRLGGIRSYTGRNVSSLGRMRPADLVEAERAVEWSRSSASTLLRFETDEEYASEPFQSLARRLMPASQIAYSAGLAWIARHKLDALLVFNGRMDATRALMEAAATAGKRFVSIERTWFGDGLQLLPDETCLGLRSIDGLIWEWRDKPLLGEQALAAGAHIASRFLRSNVNEWRAYNVSAHHEDWPAEDGALRLLFLPGSRNEVLGHPDWADGWGDKTHAYDALLAHLGSRKASVVMRCHPNWAEHIGTHDGAASERHFTQWAERRGVRVIASRDTASTAGLIDQADCVVVAGSSAGLEAGILGRQVIAVSPSIYQQGGFQDRLYGPEDLATLVFDVPLARSPAVARERARQTLRFAYSMIYRIPQYVNEVHCVSTTRYDYATDTDPQRLVRLIETGTLVPDDSRHAGSTEEGEDAVLDLIEGRKWQELLNQSRERVPPAGARAPLRRRFPFSLIDPVRDWLPRGDFW